MDEARDRRQTIGLCRCLVGVPSVVILDSVVLELIRILTTVLILALVPIVVLVVIGAV